AHAKRLFGNEDVWVEMHREEVEETLGTPIEVEPLDETQLEDLGLNTYNHDIPLSSRIEAIRLFLAYALFMGFIVYQMDVKSAFLYGTIEEEVYVYQPPGFEDPYFPNKVYNVEKALYGLHQAPKACLLPKNVTIVRSSSCERSFRYLKGQPKLGLWYPRDLPFDLEAFSNSDYVGANLDGKPQTEVVNFLGKRWILANARSRL
ncbi:putative ribonuclease H-like domain-containing protein, partial [Tanacetum coccineum]